MAMVCKMRSHCHFKFYFTVRLFPFLFDAFGVKYTVHDWKGNGRICKN